MPQLDWQLGQRLQKPAAVAVAIDAVVAAESFAALPQMMTKVAVVENPVAAAVAAAAAAVAAVCDVVAGLVAIPVSAMPVSPREN